MLILQRLKFVYILIIFDLNNVVFPFRSRESTVLCPARNRLFFIGSSIIPETSSLGSSVSIFFSVILQILASFTEINVV